jgi:hypothetical protein
MSTESSPQEIYDVIKGVVEDNYYTYKKSASEAYELLALLNGNGVGHVTCDKDDISTNYKGNWNSFCQYTDEEIEEMCDAAELEQDLKNANEFLKEDKVVKWVLPVEYIDDECFISFPEDLLEAANLKEGDHTEWINQGDGSYLLKKV